jgi:dihydropteroate synthase
LKEPFLTPLPLTASSSPLLMGILNITPDSFSDGGVFSHIGTVLEAAADMINSGADILDIGGESTRPGATEVPVEQELARVLPIISALRKMFPDVTISIDTRKAQVAECALEKGANWVNDVSGLRFDTAMAPLVAAFGCPIIVMHSIGTPETMQQNVHYKDGVVKAVSMFFEQTVENLLKQGVSQQNILLDPGFGFGKTVTDNLELLKNLHAFHSLQCPLVIGTSRKSFLTLGETEAIPVNERESLTAASIAIALQHPLVKVVRVHNVKAHGPVVRLIQALKEVSGH